MPHLISNRPRLLQLVGDRKDLRAQFRWETLNAVLYIVGSLLFLLGGITNYWKAWLIVRQAKAEKPGTP